jgi:DNA-binding IclR family transcriptional regulator
LLKLPVLALIPVLTSDREVRAARRRRWAMDLAGSTILIAAVAVVVFWQF